MRYLLGGFDPDIHTRCSECPRYFRRVTNRKTCSDRCRRLRMANQNAVLRQGRRELKEPQPAPVVVIESPAVEPTKICMYCETGFRPLHARAQTCSPLCSHRWADLTPSARARRALKVNAEMMRRGMIAPPPPPPKIGAPAACEACINWKACAGAELGGQCVAEKFKAGEPWRGSCRFQVSRGGAA